jgi:acyl-CoA synthetase (AMP-forming)/AMP-acid ligase II/thioesterase domain-containing protein
VEAAAGRHRRIAVALSPSPEYLITCLATMSSGTCLPLSAGMRRAELESAIVALKPDLLVCDRDQSSFMDAAAACGIPTLHPAANTDPGGRALPPADPGDVALVIQTSGTTGAGKNVPLTHANICAAAAYVRESMRLTGADRFLLPAPLHHIAGVALAVASISADSCTRIAPGLAAPALFDVIDDFRPTLLWATPALLAELLTVGRRIGFNKDRVPLRAIRCGAAAMDPELGREAEEFFGAPVIETYGMTEAASQITCSPLPPAARKPGSAGLPAGPEVRIRHAAGEIAVAGQEGEIEVRGPSVCSGYEDAEANVGSLRDGWLSTGDLGYLDVDGFLFVTGRCKEQIKRAGETISPVEIERVLLRHPAVREAAVFGIPDRKLGESVGAAVVFAPGTSCDAAQLRAFAAENLSDVKVPLRVVVVDEIPRTASGKIQRASMAERLGLAHQAAPARPGFIEPRDAVERELTAIWQEVLKIDRLGVNDDFYALGGGSLAVMRMLAAVQERYGAGNRLAERVEFFARPTIAHQAASLRAALEQRPAEAPIAEGVQRLSNGQGLLSLFCVPGARADVSYFAAMARYAAPHRSIYGIWNFSCFARGAGASVEDLAAELITRVRTVQPMGPYLLGGHCYGGILAYEMSQQLRSAGEKVDAVLLFDTPRPLYPNPRRHYRLYASRAAEAARQVRKLSMRKRFEVTLEGCRTLFVHIQRLAVSTMHHERMMRTGWTLPSSGESDLLAARAYNPERYSGRVIHFLADCNGFRSPLDPRRGWRELAPSLEEVIVPGDHTTMFHDPNVGEMARYVEASLTENKNSVAQGSARIGAHELPDFADLVGG